MADVPDVFSKYTVPQLKAFLSKRGVTTANNNKTKLIELARQAVKHNVSELEDDDHLESLVKRRKIGHVMMPPVEKC